MYQPSRDNLFERLKIIVHRLFLIAQAQHQVTVGQKFGRRSVPGDIENKARVEAGALRRPRGVAARRQIQNLIHLRHKDPRPERPALVVVFENQDARRAGQRRLLTAEPGAGIDNGNGLSLEFYQPLYVRGLLVVRNDDVFAPATVNLQVPPAPVEHKRYEQKIVSFPHRYHPFFLRDRRRIWWFFPTCICGQSRPRPCSFPDWMLWKCR